MSALVLTLREPPPERLDLSGLTPSRLRGLSTDAIARLPVGTSRFGLRLGDCFAIAGDDSTDLRLEGGSSRLDRLGEGWSEGSIRVEGDVGQRLGVAMTGGAITVQGSAGPFAGSGATGGRITIAGDADERAGGALYGAMAGLDGATLVIRGRAGPRLGDRMRRGLIVAERADDFAGCRMIAGTLVAGTLGDHPGYGMRRGTILTGSCGRVGDSFAETGTHRLVFARLLQRSLRSLAPHLATLAEGDLDRRAGDLATLGKGEVLLPRR